MFFLHQKKLRDQYELLRDNGDVKYIEFFDSKAWCKNQFQVTNQITMVGKRTNRYDVTILINGFPLVQVELKRRGVELGNAFNQVNRYHRDSYKGLFMYIQIFVISNGINTKYFANCRDQSFSHTYNWTDEENNRVNDIEKFSEVFLEKCHISKMIAKYTVVHETKKKIMVLRPYQYYATEKIINLVESNNNKNGYIWHTTGSGKTLTSFKTSQILSTMEGVDKILFVVDRKDLDNQTIKEFKAFSEDSVAETKNTGNLEKQLSDDKIKLTVTTIQKLNNVISKKRYLEKVQRIRNKRFIIIFDECHRTQFGKTHKRINEFFTNKQLIGFTGTPIFKENNIKGSTTAELFHKCLHTYTIKDAIADDNVLGFSVEYLSTFKSKYDIYDAMDDENSLISENDSNEARNDFYGLDDKVYAIDKKEVYEHKDNLNNIVNTIIGIHNRKTYNREYTAFFAVSNVKTAIKYYELFKSKNTDLKIASIFTYDPNEAIDYSGDFDELETEIEDRDSRSKLDNIVKDFNNMFGTNHNLDKTEGFNSYFVAVSDKVKEKKIDILIVVNMFLTGFDAPSLNTLYVDRNLKYHGLIQAFSRTNRIEQSRKRHGNIVCFRNLKNNTDKAIKTFSNGDNRDVVLKDSYDNYLIKLNDLLDKLINQVPNVQDVDRLEGDVQITFIKLFRDIAKFLNIISTFTEFTFDDLKVNEQTIEDYKGKYLDLCDEFKRRKAEGEKESIVDEIDFRVELVRRDRVDVQYIIDLIMNLDKNKDSFIKDKQYIYQQLEITENLRSKRVLIKKFIEENFIESNDLSDIEANLNDFMEKEKNRELEEYSSKENLSLEGIKNIITHYEFTNRVERDEIGQLSNENLKFIERCEKVPIWTTFIENIIEKYTW